MRWCLVILVSAQCAGSLDQRIVWWFPVVAIHFPLIHRNLRQFSLEPTAGHGVDTKFENASFLGRASLLCLLLAHPVGSRHNERTKQMNGNHRNVKKRSEAWDFPNVWHQTDEWRIPIFPFTGVPEHESRNPNPQFAEVHSYIWYCGDAIWKENK